MDDKTVIILVTEVFSLNFDGYSPIPFNLMVNIDRQNFKTTKIMDPCFMNIIPFVPQINSL